MNEDNEIHTDELIPTMRLECIYVNKLDNPASL